jgi:ATP-dependent DNA helicase RecQ
VRELGTVSGVGEKKLATYGEGVLAVLAALDAPAPTEGDAQDADWPEPDEEPEPDDWI